MKVSIQAARLDIRLHIGWHGKDERAVCSLRTGADLVGEMRQLQMHIVVVGERVKGSSSLEYFDVAVHGVQVFHVFDAGNAQRSIHRADVLDARTVRNVDGVIDHHLHTLILRIARSDGNRVRFGVNFDGNTLQIGLLLFCGLYRANLDLVAIPSLDIHGSVAVFQLQGTPGFQGIELIKLLADRKAGNGPNNGYKQYTQSSCAESWSKHNVLPPSSTC